MERLSFPPACAKCEPFEGNWQETPAGLKRCDCARGIALSGMKRGEGGASSTQPVISAEVAAQAARSLGAIPFFPSAPEAQTMIANEIASLCHSSTEAFWLVQRMLALYNRWPGSREMRMVFCQRYRPLSGLDAAQLSWSSETYPEGIPSEKPQPTQALKTLPAGRDVSASPSIEAAVIELAKAKRMPAPREPLRMCSPLVPQIPEVRPQLRRITQADIDRAVQENRDSRARREFDVAPEERAMAAGE